jgi:excisionase family DNA binding protein
VNILLEVVESFSKGKSVTVVAHESSITTQEAADFVGVSRPTLIKLLEEFKVPYATVGRHRKLAFQDVQQLSTLLREKRLSTLQSIREKSQAIGEYEETLNNPLIK